MTLEHRTAIQDEDQQRERFRVAVDQQDGEHMTAVVILERLERYAREDSLRDWERRYGQQRRPAQRPA